MVIDVRSLSEFAEALLQAAGSDQEEAAIVASSLVDADLCGHPSHGVIRVTEYAEQLARKELVSGAPLRTVTETAAILVADAQFGFGQVQCRRLIERLLPKARSIGIAGGTLRNCGHVGRLGEWVERIAGHGLAALMTVNDNGVLKCVAPPGGLDPCISTNPLAIAVPTKDAQPLVLDMSTSVVANGKIRVAQLAGRRCPDGWLQDPEGHSTNDPAARFADRPATILPLGGDQSYKGFGLGLLLDVLVGGLSGGSCPPAGDGGAATNNAVFVVWDPERFSGREHLMNQAARLIGFVRGSRRKAGVDRIQLPGDRSAALREANGRKGVPLDEGTWEVLVALANRLSVSPPRECE